VIGVAAAGYQISSQTPGLWQPVTSTGLDNGQQSSSSEPDSESQSSESSVSTSSSSTSSKTSTAGSANVKISAAEAKSIASKSIGQEGATAGTPKLTQYGDTLAYMVPVMVNGQQVGAIYIDANTGKNLGGEGGAP
jgi:uncharacterized membrane protein YkoI